MAMFMYIYVYLYIYIYIQVPSTRPCTSMHPTLYSWLPIWPGVWRVGRNVSGGQADSLLAALAARSPGGWPSGPCVFSI